MDDPEIDYMNFIQDINSEYKGSMFKYSYDAEYFFNTLKKIINEKTVYSNYGFEILCHRYGVNGYQRMPPKQIAELLDMTPD